MLARGEVRNIYAASDEPDGPRESLSANRRFSWRLERICNAPLTAGLKSRPFKAARVARTEVRAYLRNKGDNEKQRQQREATAKTSAILTSGNPVTDICFV
jgi:hypothetical protein